MARYELVALLQVSRIDSSLIAAGVIFFPLLVEGFNAIECSIFALPMLTGSMSGFVLNDIYDLEKDKINHAGRPIPMGKLSVFAAMIFYFALLFVTLIFIAIFMPPKRVFLFLFFLILMMNYNYIVEIFPKMKNLYVAGTSTLPIIITQNFITINPLQLEFPVAVFGFVFGRELLMDTLDAQGDGSTLAKMLGEARSVGIAFFTHFVSIIILFTISDTWLKIVSLGVIALIWLFCVLWWKETTKRKVIIHSMKIQMLASMVFFF